MAELVVLGGYLGAGKTTFLNQVLAGGRGKRIAVVVNDFGAIDIDASLIEWQDDDVVQFKNGCICCQLKDNATPVMRELAARGDLDHVLVELSGVALPGTFTAWGTTPGLQPGPVVVAADVHTVRRRADDEFVGDVVRGQLAQADVVLLTKHQQVSAERSRQVADWLAAEVPQARVVLAPLAEAVDLESLLPTSGEGVRQDTDPAGHAADVFCSEEITGGPVADVAAVADLVTEHGETVERIKGFVTDTAGTVHVLHWAGTTVETTEVPDSARTGTQLVVITTQEAAAGEGYRELLDGLRELTDGS